MTTITPRRSLDDSDPDGHQESDKDFVLNNLAACVAWLEAQTEGTGIASQDGVRVLVLDDAANMAEQRPLTTYEISGIREAARYLRSRHKA